MNDVPKQTAGGERSVVRGEVVRKLFESDDLAFAVLKLRDDSGREFTVRGPLGGLAPGQHIEADGCWDKHPDFGLEFKAETCRISLPGTAEGLKRFLGSGSIPGIGKKIAAELVDYFGEKTLAALSAGPEKLREVPGIGKKKAEAISECWKNASDRRESYIYLQGLGITSAYCARLFKRYGDRAPA